MAAEKEKQWAKGVREPTDVYAFLSLFYNASDNDDGSSIFPFFSLFAEIYTHARARVGTIESFTPSLVSRAYAEIHIPLNAPHAALPHCFPFSPLRCFFHLHGLCVCITFNSRGFVNA